MNLIKYNYGELYYYVSDQDSIITFLKEKGSYQSWIVKTAEKYYRPNSIVLDVGANIGTMSVGMAKFAKKVYAFEPVKKTFKCLRTNIKHNKLENVEVYNFGLDRFNGKRLINFNENLTGASSFYDNIKNSIQKEVNVKKLDDLNLTNISVIKIDVQSAEMDVLVGGIETIKENDCALIVELSLKTEEEQKRSKDVELFLNKNGFILNERASKDCLFIKKI